MRLMPILPLLLLRTSQSVQGCPVEILRWLTGPSLLRCPLCGASPHGAGGTRQRGRQTGAPERKGLRCSARLHGCNTGRAAHSTARQMLWTCAVFMLGFLGVEPELNASGGSRTNLAQTAAGALRSAASAGTSAGHTTAAYNAGVGACDPHTGQHAHLLEAAAVLRQPIQLPSGVHVAHLQVQGVVDH